MARGKKAKLAHGTIFAVPLPDGTYVCGRVMLDVEACLKQRLLPHDSPLPFYRSCHLVEMYSAMPAAPEYVPSPVYIPGAFMPKKEVGRAWPIVGYEVVDPRTVEFPEHITGFQGANRNAFSCGEIHIEVPIGDKRVEEIDCRGSFDLGTDDWIYECLNALGRYDFVPTKWWFLRWNRSDLRFSRFGNRADVYEHLPFDMEMSYFDKQATLGLDFARLYHDV